MFHDIRIVTTNLDGSSKVEKLNSLEEMLNYFSGEETAKKENVTEEKPKNESDNINKINAQIESEITNLLNSIKIMGGDFSQGSDEVFDRAEEKKQNFKQGVDGIHNLKPNEEATITLGAIYYLIHHIFNDMDSFNSNTMKSYVEEKYRVIMSFLKQEIDYSNLAWVVYGIRFSKVSNTEFVYNIVDYKTGDQSKIVHINTKTPEFEKWVNNAYDLDYYFNLFSQTKIDILQKKISGYEKLLSLADKISVDVKGCIDMKSFESMKIEYYNTLRVVNIYNGADDDEYNNNNK